MTPPPLDAGELERMRIDRARQALDRGQPEIAIVEAEELLDERPDAVEALVLVGRAHHALGEALAAATAYQQALRRDEEHPEALLGFARTSLELLEFRAALEASLAATRVLPETAEAWALHALALEWLDQPEAAAASWRRAAELDPEEYPLVTPLDKDDWRDALHAARGMLAPPLARWLRGTRIVLEDRPALAHLRATDPPQSPFIWALYEGPRPAPDEDAWLLHPPAIRLYRRNLERVAAVDGPLAHRVAEALRHEALDWLGLHPDDYPLA